MAGMNNLSAEVAAADQYGHGIRLMTVGTGHRCGDGGPAGNNHSYPNWRNKTGPNDCNEPFPAFKSLYHSWVPASANVVGGKAWSEFSAVCWLFGRDVFDGLGGTTPIGLISSNWGGTPLQAWAPLESLQECNPYESVGGVLYNSMIAPMTVGPLALSGFTWCESLSHHRNLLYMYCPLPPQSHTRHAIYA